MFKQIVQAVGFLAACVALYAWFTAPTAGLEADVYFADFELPSSIAQQFRALAPLTTPAESRGLFFKRSLRERILPDTSGTVDQLLASVANFANEKASIIHHSNDFAYKGYWRVTVRNTGSKSASSVALHFPMLASGVISKSHGDPAPVQELPVASARVFSLGNIQPGDDEIVVHAWTLPAATADAAQKITLTHDVGSGRIRITR